MNLLRFAIIVLCSAIVVPSIRAQSDQKDAAEQKGVSSTAQPGSYQDTADSLHVLLQQLLSAIEKNEVTQAPALTHGFILPAYQTWFPKVFGDEAGARMAEKYGESLSKFDANFKQQMQLYIKEGMTEITVTLLESADQPSTDSYAIRAIRAMRNPVPVYSVAMGKAGAASWNVSGIFVFEQGGFRFVDLLTIHALDNSSASSPKIFHVGHNVQAARMIHQVMPQYPSEAKSKGIQGTVLLHATIAKDGTVAHLSYIGGPAELVKSAMAAVKQWRYEPTRLDGQPVEVNTTISVVFTLGR
jgi:TonB family protein